MNLVWLLLLLFSCQLSQSVDVSLTLSIPPRKRECFHEAMTTGVAYEVEYQVPLGLVNIVGYVYNAELRNTDANT